MAALRKAGMGKAFFVYIMTNPRKTVLYTGVTNNLARRVHEHKERLPLGFALYAVTYLGFGLAPGAWTIWPLLVLYGGYLSIGEGIGRALVADCTPQTLRATGMGFYHGAFGGGVLLASLAAGLLWDAMGPSLPFYLGSGMATLAFLVGLRFLPGSEDLVADKPVG